MLEKGVVVFLPHFPLVDGLTYALLVGVGGAGDPPEVWTLERAARPVRPSTKVAAIYPTADVVPMNLLKIYVYFSAPMSEGCANRAVEVCRADDGARLENVFLPMEPELWDLQRQRLTLLLDPGRIKRGLAPHEEVGYPLIEGAPILLRVAPTFLDAAGQTLAAQFEQRYNVGPLERTRVDPSLWRCEAPSAGSTRGLTVSFGRPLDHALLQHSLKVVDAAGVLVSGEATDGPGEWCWWFEPDSPWQPGRYELVVDPRLEDLAGNSLVRVFDRDLLRSEDTPGDSRPARISFEVR